MSDTPQDSKADVPPGESQATEVNQTQHWEDSSDVDRDSHYTSKYSKKTEPRQGGMAIVWRAFDSKLKREVAYKEMRPDNSDDQQFRTMFLHEAQVTGQLEHPNIVPIYELGEVKASERPYYTMRYVRGKSLAEVIREHHQQTSSHKLNRRGLSRLLNIFLDIANAIGYANSRGIVHRDLKPDNVMVGDFGEVLVLDWGLSKLVGSNETDLPPVKLSSVEVFQTQAGVRKGTPAYWAPEQQQGQVDLIDARTDVYGLGAILYEMLTSNAPHSRKSSGQDSAVAQQQPVAPRDVTLAVPAPLNAVCVKALQLQRSKRYSSAKEMLGDIEAYLVDEPVSAHRESLYERLLRQSRRHQLVTLVGLVGLAAVALIVLSMKFLQYEHHKSLLNSEIENLSSIASQEQATLTADIESLRQDVTFLGSLDEVVDFLQKHENRLASSPMDDASVSTLEVQQRAVRLGPEEELLQQKVETLFAGFLQEKLDYVQVRLLNAQGCELVRVDRKKPGDDPLTVPLQAMQNKRDRPYFEGAINAPAGGWYLSAIELNVENKQKQKDLPVIRGAVPVYLTPQSVQPSGVVIINLHYQELVRNMRRYRDAGDTERLVYLTNRKGQFLFHPEPDLAFAFERDLDYRIWDVYPNLHKYYYSTSASIGKRELHNQRSDPALWIRPLINSKRRSEIKQLYSSAREKIEDRLQAMKQQQASLVWNVGTEGEAVVKGASLSPDGLEEVATSLKGELGIPVDTLVFPKPADRGVDHTVYFRRLQLERGQEDRYLGLVFVVPDTGFGKTAGFYRMIISIATILAVLAVLVTMYFSNRTPRGRAMRG